MDIIKIRGESFYAFLISLLLHGGLFLVLLSVAADETLRGDIFFIRVISLADLADLTEKGNPAGEAFSSPADIKKELSRKRQSEIAIRDKNSDSENLLDELKSAKQDDLEPVQNFPGEALDRAIPSDGASVFNSREELHSTSLSFRDDERGPSRGEALSGLNSPEGPSILELVKPLYPSLARRLGKEGTVLLKLHIDEMGRPLEVEIIKRAGYGFDEAALNAIKQSRFRPAMKNGIPVSSVVIVPVRFVLEK